MSDSEPLTSTGFYGSAWLIVARGGWWKVPAIVDELPLEVDAWTAHELLWCMAHRHQMLVTRGRRKDREYAVTAECRVPRGLQAGDLAKALTGRAFPAGAAA